MFYSKFNLSLIFCQSKIDAFFFVLKSFFFSKNAEFGGWGCYGMVSKCVSLTPMNVIIEILTYEVANISDVRIGFLRQKRQFAAKDELFQYENRFFTDVGLSVNITCNPQPLATYLFGVVKKSNTTPVDHRVVLNRDYYIYFTF